MNHRANPRFWKCYQALPADVRELADRNYKLLCADPNHPSLNLKRIGKLWSARVGIGYRTLAIEDSGDLIWVWIGSHSEYDKILRRSV